MTKRDDQQEGQHAQAHEEPLQPSRQAPRAFFSAMLSSARSSRRLPLEEVFQDVLFGDLVPGEFGLNGCPR